MANIALSPIDSFDSYMNAIYDTPFLTAEEEHQLAVDYAENNNVAAAHKLMISHLRFVVFIARKFDGYGLPFADIVQEGNVGLMKAVQRYNPHVGVRLLAFAAYWIRAEINEFIIRNWRIVKIATTKAQRKLFFKLRSQKREGDWFSADEVSMIANEMDVKESDVRTMEGRLRGYDASLEKPTSDKDGEEYDLDVFCDENNSIELLEEMDHEMDTKQRVLVAVNTLTEREQEIIYRRWLVEEGGATLKDLAETFGVTVERVRQIEQQAIKKLKLQIAA